MTRIFRSALCCLFLCVCCSIPWLVLPCASMASRGAKTKPHIAFAKASKLLRRASQLRRDAKRKSCSPSSLRPMLRGVVKQLSAKIKDRNYKDPKAARREQRLLRQLLRSPRTKLPSRLCRRFQVDMGNIYVERATELVQPFRRSHPGRSHRLLGRRYLVYDRYADALRHIRRSMQYFIQARDKAAYRRAWGNYYNVSRKLHKKTKVPDPFPTYLTTQVRMNVGRAIGTAVQQTYSQTRKDFDAKKISLKRLKRTISIYISLLQGLRKKAYQKGIEQLRVDLMALGTMPLKRWVARFCDQLKLYVKSGRVSCLYRKR